MQTQSYYQKAIKFAALKHVEQNQLVPGTNLPYVVHLSNVAMEILMAAQNSPNFEVDFAVQAALLHDTLEDTSTTFEELTEAFGAPIAEGVLALTKNENLPKSERMEDSLNRIRKLQKEIWAVKLADRITNLQMPPQHWDLAKKIGYQKEALLILEELKGGNTFLENRLRLKIAEYEKYLQT
jgi:guanosine-3',5'-bis(diphosphate) 3'-pyrophosphohydrolase